MNQIKTLTLLLLMTGGLLTSLHSYAAKIHVTTDRDPVSLNESFEMTFEADSSVDGDPDFSPLNKDFRVLSSSVSSNMSIVNGNISSTKQWRLSLMALHTGHLIIPAISFGSDRSQPSSVNVTAGNAGSNLPGHNSRREVFMEVSATPDNPYVQSQVIYTIRLFRGVATSNSVLSDPKVSGAQAVIERVGDDVTYETQRMGKRFNVVERTYAIYPQTSGRINIEPVVFQAETVSGFSSFFSNPFGPPTKSIVIQSDPVVLNVKPEPATFPGSEWLPAKGLELKQEWSRSQPQFKVGEPITRTLTIKAHGLMSSQLPELPKWKTTDFRQSPDQPILKDDKTRFGITGTRTEKTALIPNRAGEFDLPAIRIPWWNTDDNKIEYAEIPAQKIIVPPPVGSAAPARPVMNPVPLATPNSKGTTSAAEQATPGSGLSHAVPGIQPSISGQWRWISLGLFVLWLATLLLWRWSGRNTRTVAANPGKESLRKLTQGLKTACQANDARQARDRLLYWARQNRPERRVLSISDVAAYSSADLAAQIRILNDALYSSRQQAWDGAAFWQVFTREQKKQEADNAANTSKLEPLFRI